MSVNYLVPTIKICYGYRYTISLIVYKLEIMCGCKLFYTMNDIIIVWYPSLEFKSYFLYMKAVSVEENSNHLNNSISNDPTTIL